MTCMQIPAYTFMTCILLATDADEKAERVGRKVPFVMICETNEGREYIVYVEKEHLISTKSVVDVVADLICTYFVSDLVYPRNIYPLLIFFQHIMTGLRMWKSFQPLL